MSDDRINEPGEIACSMNEWRDLRRNLRQARKTLADALEQNHGLVRQITQMAGEMSQLRKDLAYVKRRVTALDAINAARQLARGADDGELPYYRSEHSDDSGD